MLDDAMVFHLACLPTSTFDHVQSIYEQHAHDSLKGQKVSKAKQASAKQPDLNKREQLQVRSWHGSQHCTHTAY